MWKIAFILITLSTHTAITGQSHEAYSTKAACEAAIPLRTKQLEDALASEGAPPYVLKTGCMVQGVPA